MSKEKHKCQAEDQGGWPACDKTATWYVPADQSIGGDIRYFCDTHHESNRFYNPDDMLPLSRLKRIFAKLKKGK